MYKKMIELRKELRLRLQGDNTPEYNKAVLNIIDAINIYIERYDMTEFLA
jgi:hypothetical protein